MTMEVESSPGEMSQRDEIIDSLSKNDEICFKSQQINENDLTKEEKSDIARQIYDKSKLTFLTRFGQYLNESQLDFFEQFTHGCEESQDISLVLKDFHFLKKKGGQVKNRRYEALKEMIGEGSYFSELEMMKRNPLLYEQLVGQYLTEEEKTERDRIVIDDQSTLVKILMEGIERDDAKEKKQQQQDYEDEVMEEDEDEDEKSEEGSDAEPSCSAWGEFTTSHTNKRRKRKKNVEVITAQEQKLLKEEFITTMYQNFLDGKDNDFDYSAVDYNDKYDGMETRDHDEEDRYFDSEEPETVEISKGEEESEDELDIYMSAVNQHPAVQELSNSMKKL